jgi:hypothetical protein
LCFAMRFLHACPCQKHPSANTASLAFPQTKSGRPSKLEFLRQPPALQPRKIFISVSSVVLFPELRIRAISCARVIFAKVVTSRCGSPGHLRLGILALFCIPASQRHEYLPTGCTSIKRRHGISYEIADFVDFFTFKFVIHGEALKQRGFSY